MIKLSSIWARYFFIFIFLIALNIYLNFIWGWISNFIFFVFLTITELILQYLIKKYAVPNGVIPLLKTPKISKSIIKRFVDHGFDAELGWVRKANTSKIDSGLPYKIDKQGSRENPCSNNFKTNIASFGDSYCFCREVSDSETWQSYLTEYTNTKVLNFGVGNYGFDQALLRLKREYPKIKTQYVIMGIVPHTIARILSVWKHYNEFGNILAFKPRFYIKNNKLKLLDNFITSPEKFNETNKFIHKVNAHDFFYETKFLKEAYFFPFLFSVLKNPKRFIYFILKSIRNVFKTFSRFTYFLDKIIIEFLDSEGPKQLHLLYKSEYATSLLLALIDDFYEYSEKHSFIPIILIMPMKDDLLYMQKYGNFYSNTFIKTSNNIKVIDLSEKILDEDDIPSLFNKWHYSKKGNQLVAKTLSDFIERVGSKPTK